MMTYNTNASIIGRGTVSAAAIQQWSRCFLSSIEAHTAQSMPLMTACRRATVDTSIEVTCPSVYFHMTPRVFSLGQDFKVFWPIICTVLVAMVDMFITPKRTPKHLFSYKAMLIDPTFATGVVNDYVPHRHTARSHVVWRTLQAIGDMAALFGAVLRLRGAGSLYLKHGIALFALNSNTLDSGQTLALYRAVLSASLANSCRSLLERFTASLTNAIHKGDGILGAHRMVLSSGATLRAVTAAPGLFVASILPCAWEKEAV